MQDRYRHFKSVKQMRLRETPTQDCYDLVPINIGYQSKIEPTPTYLPLEQPFFFHATLGIRWPTGQRKLLNEKFRIEYKMMPLNSAAIQHH